MPRKIMSGDTVKIVAVGPNDATYNKRDEVVGLTGVVIDIGSSSNEYRGWKFVDLNIESLSKDQCSFYHQVKVKRIKNKETKYAS